MRLVAGAYDSLLSLDRSFGIDKAMLENGQALIDARAERELLKCLPSETMPRTLLQSITLLNAFKDGKCFEMATGAAQRKAECTLEIVSNMAQAISPDPTIIQGGPFYKEVLNRLALFVRAEDERGREYFGKAALDLKWKAVAAEMDNVELTVSLADLETFQCHKWLLSAAQVEELSKGVRLVLSKSGKDSGDKHMMSSAPASSSASPKETKTKASKHSQSDSVKASVMKYF